MAFLTSTCESLRKEGRCGVFSAVRALIRVGKRFHLMCAPRIEMNVSKTSQRH